MTQHFAVAIFEVEQVYGGPEEGGWWYTDGPLQFVDSFHTDEDDASARCRDLNDLHNAADEAGATPSRVATVVPFPRTEREFDSEGCHLQESELGDEITKFDIPLWYRGDFRPHYC